MTDHFTKFAVTVPTANQKAKTVAKCFGDNFISCYGVPERLLRDQGPDFESKLMKELCEQSGFGGSGLPPTLLSGLIGLYSVSWELWTPSRR